MATFIVGGCSGSATPSFSRPLYGHNTTALGVLIQGSLYAVDNGTGVGTIARMALKAGVGSAYILQTHLHDDHKIGLATNPILFRPGFVRELISSRQGGSFREEYEQAFKKSSWPVSPATFGVEHQFREFEPGERLDVGALRVRTLQLPHPEGSVAYRICTSAGDVVIATDVELVAGEAQVALADFISGAALVYLDCQYRDSEYAGEVAVCDDMNGARSRAGWGHSTPRQIGAMLALTRELPRRLVLGHHDPERTDRDLFAFEHEVSEYLAPVATRSRFITRNESVMLVSFTYDGAMYEF